MLFSRAIILRQSKPVGLTHTHTQEGSAKTDERKRIIISGILPSLLADWWCLRDLFHFDDDNNNAEVEFVKKKIDRLTVLRHITSQNDSHEGDRSAQPVQIIDSDYWLYTSVHGYAGKRKVNERFTRNSDNSHRS